MLYLFCTELTPTIKTQIKRAIEAGDTRSCRDIKITAVLGIRSTNRDVLRPSCRYHNIKEYLKTIRNEPHFLQAVKYAAQRTCPCSLMTYLQNKKLVDSTTCIRLIIENYRSLNHMFLYLETLLQSPDNDQNYIASICIDVIETEIKEENFTRHDFRKSSPLVSNAHLEDIFSHLISSEISEKMILKIYQLVLTHDLDSHLDERFVPSHIIDLWSKCDQKQKENFHQLSISPQPEELHQNESSEFMPLLTDQR